MVPEPPGALPPIPAGPVTAVEGTVEVQILGPVRVSGWPGDTPERATVTELAAYLALHPGGHTAAVLADALSNPDRRLSLDSVRTYLNALRRALGAGAVPDGGHSGYTLPGVTTDWHRFQALTADSTDAPHSTDGPDSSLQRAVDALSLVRGAPFADSPRGGYEWAFHHPAVTAAETAVLAAASHVAGAALAARRPALAVWAAEQGLLVAATDETLMGVLLDAAAIGGPDRLAAAWRDVTHRHAHHDEPVPPSLHDRYRQLGQHPPPAGRAAPATTSGPRRHEDVRR